MSENILQTLQSWTDEPDEKVRIGAMAGLATIVYGAKSGFDAVASVYPDDALGIVLGTSIVVAGAGAVGLYTYGKKAGQRMETETPAQTPPVIDPEEIREVVQRSEPVVADEVAEVVQDTINVNTDAFDELMSDLANKAYHIFIPSTSGSGKTTLINHFLNTQLGEKDSYLVLDGKIEGDDSLKYADSKYTVNDPKKYSAVLNRVVAQMEKRQAKSMYEYPKLHVVIDESSLLDQESMDLVVELLSRSRSANIKVILMTQSVSAKINGTEGITDLLNRITILNLGFDDRNDRVVSYARIASGKIKNIGREIKVPKLDAPWNVDLEFEDDTDSFDFGDDMVKNIDTSVTTPIIDVVSETTLIRDESDNEQITKITEMLSELVGADLTSVVEESRRKVVEMDHEELPPMLRETSEEDKNKYDFQPQKNNDKENPSLRLTCKIMRNVDLSDSGYRIGKNIVTNGDLNTIKFLNKWFNGNDPDGNHRREICELTFDKYSPYHFKVISSVLGDK